MVLMFFDLLGAFYGIILMKGIVLQSAQPHAKIGIEP